MSMPAISGQMFLDAVRPALAAGSARALARNVLRYWEPAQIGRLLQHPDADVRRAAALTLGYVGDRTCVATLARALRDTDETVNAMAEEGLWLLWFRGGRPAALKSFCDGISLLNTEQYAPALECFREAIRLDPEFAEAYNQCAIAHFLMRQPARAIKDARQVLRLMPEHFGALCGMGNAYIQLGDLEAATRCFRRALQINPRMPSVAATLQQLETRLRRMNDSSGIFQVGQVPA